MTAPEKHVSVHKHTTGTKVTDDGTLSFFWRPHHITGLIITILPLLYTTLTEDPAHEKDWEYNTKRGILAMIWVFLGFSVTMVPNGPFTRPHPLVWKITLCLGLVYQFGLVFLLFQSPSSARRLFKYFDKDLGEPLNFTAYGHECDIYDPVNFPDDPWHNVIHKMDGFVVAHFFGWMFKALMVRDVWIANVLSILFELLEYTFEHQMPNFSECWWDHWILDFIICNGGGILLGYYIMNFLKNKAYDWRGLYNQPDNTSKAQRIIAQFSPYSWVSFHWGITKSLKNWIVVTTIIALYSISELNTFYLKFVLWIPAGHRLVLTRLWCLVFWGSPATREIYDFMVGETKKIGPNFWIFIMICVTECLVVYKFGAELTVNPMPSHIKTCWITFFVIYILWSLWKFQMKYTEVEPNSPEHRRASQAGYLKEFPRVFAKDTPEDEIIVPSKSTIRKRK